MSRAAEARARLDKVGIDEIAGNRETLVDLFKQTGSGIAGAFGWSILLNRMRTLQNTVFTTPAPAEPAPTTM